MHASRLRPFRIGLNPSAPVRLSRQTPLFRFFPTPTQALPTQFATLFAALFAALSISTLPSLILPPPAAAQGLFSTPSASPTDTLRYTPFRIGVVPGISTVGVDPLDTRSTYSLNLLFGVHGALTPLPDTSRRFRTAFELGLLGNVNTRYAEGAQITGLVNASGGTADGFKLAGLANLSASHAAGLQIAGLANVSMGDLEGLMLSGLFSYSEQDMAGLGAFGLAGVARGSMEGLMVSGGLLASPRMSGLFASPVVVTEEGEGLFVSAISVSRSQSGLQAGVLNVSEVMEGLQFGYANVTSRMTGLQIGLLNVSQRAEGLQIGLLNVAQEFEGMPVGLLSIYGNGRLDVDVWNSDLGSLNLGLKLGTSEVYNMVSVGINPLLGPDVWQVGWSIGTPIPFKAAADVADITDFSIFKLNDGAWDSAPSTHISLRYLRLRELAPEARLYYGPTLNMLLLERGTDQGRLEDAAPYRLFRIRGQEKEASFWVGYTLGFELF